MIRNKNMYGPRSQRPNREVLNDDPGALLGLPPLEKSSEFWKRYDRQADTHDTKMTENLSENLDVLLIFAALFSAINTTFISLSMPGLSSDPLTETNALLRLLVTRADNNTLVPTDLSPQFAPSSNSVVVNCLLYASLSCSLLAAVGAMMAKEWLQSFDRTGQTGPLEEQGRFRQRKFSGVQRWYLEPIIQALPNLLLLSVMLFFIGVYLFLLPVNQTVAGVVITFSGGGAVLCGIAIITGATAPLCPYQSAASRALKHLGVLRSLQWWRDLLRAVVDLVVRGPAKLVRKLFDGMHHYPSIAPAIAEIAPIKPVSTTLGEAGISEQVLIAQAAGWLLATTSNHGDQITAAQFMCTLDNTVCASALEDSETWRHLASLTYEAFNIWHDQPTERNQEIAELFGLALCQVLLTPFKSAVKRKYLTDLPTYQSTSFGGAFLQAFEFVSNNYSYYRFEDKEMIVYMAFLFATVSRGSAILEYQWPRLSRFCWIGRTHHLADVLLGLCAIIFYNIDPDRNRNSCAFVELVDQGENKTVLAQHLSNAAVCGPRVLPSVRGKLQSDLLAARGYTACWQRAVELSHQIPLNDRTKVVDSVADLIVSYVEPLTSSTSRESGSGLVDVSIKAVLALHAFASRNPRSNEISISRDAPSEQLRDGRLINAAVHIMLDDLEGLTNSNSLPRTQPQALARARALALALARRRVRREQVQVRVRVQGVQVEVEAGVWAKDPAAERLVKWVQDEAREQAQLRAGLQALARELVNTHALAQAVEPKAKVEAKAQAEALLQALATALAEKVAQQVAPAMAQEVTQEVTPKVVQELAPELKLELERELARELTRELRRELAPELAQELGADLGWVLSQVGDKALGQMLGEVLGPVLDRMLDRVLGRGLSQVLGRVLERVQILTHKRLRVESCIIRVLLWVWKRTSSTQRDHSDKRKIFLSSCRLWVPLETRVDFAINGIEWGINGERLVFSDGNRDKLLTLGDLDGIVEFAEDLQKDMAKSKFFVGKQVDVEINRLCAHFNRRIDWNYDLYDLREPTTLCSRSTVIENGMM